MKKNYYIRARSSEILTKEIGDETLIFDLRENKAFCLNETAVLVWNMCDGKRSVEQIREAFAERTSLEIEEDFIWLALEQLRKENLLENTDGIENHFKGIARREIIKKVGFGSMVVLPLIGQVVAPPASLAQSILTAPGGMCVMPNECTSGTCSVSTCCVPLNDVGCNVVADCCNSGVQCIANTCVP